MSSETSKWLNQNVLIGMTEQRGTAWHYRASDQGDEPNHYPGPIPIGDVERRLFDWEAIVVPSYWGKPVRDDDGKIQYDSVGNPIVMPELDPDRCYVIASDTDERFATFTDTYTPHQYRPWLLGNVGHLLDDDLVISSAGLLDGRGIAWVEVSVPETQETAGVQFRPNLLATTSFNGKVATTYARTITAVVCDNTHTAALNESGAKYRVKHTKYSGMRVMEAREALEIIWSTRDQMSDAINRLTDATISEGQWEILLKTVIPDTGTQKGDTQAANRRDAIDRLWRYDSRVAPWKNSMFGAYQAWNTWNHHERGNAATLRAERNMKEAIDGATEKRDRIMLDAIDLMMDGKLTKVPERAGK